MITGGVKKDAISIPENPPADPRLCAAHPAQFPLRGTDPDPFFEEKSRATGNTA